MTVDSQNNSDSQMCRQCQGLCCQGHPGVWISPKRFLASFDLPRPSSPEILRNMLPRELVLRDIDGVAVPAPKSSEAGCIFLEEHGCMLPENRRPEQCLALVPAIETLIDGEIQCELKPEGSTQTAIQNWRAYWDKTSSI